MTVLPARPALDEIDQDLLAACIKRHNAWRPCASKTAPTTATPTPTPATKVDDLLDMRNEMIVAERIVTL